MEQITIEYIYEDIEDIDDGDMNCFKEQMEEILMDFEPGATVEFCDSEMSFGDGIMFISEPLHSEKEIIEYLNNNTDYIPCGFKRYEPFE